MDIQAGVGVSHHRNPRVAGHAAAQKALEVEHQVTRSQGNVIYEVDGRHVLDVLKA